MKTIKMGILFGLLVVFMVTGIGSAAVITVGSDPNDDYSTVQSAIDASSSGDEIIVSTGTYNELINFNGKDIHLKSTDPDGSSVAASTIIDGSGLGSNVVTFNSGETSSAILEGLTVTGGTDGIYVWSGATPTIKKCIFRNNTGRGIYVSSGGPTTFSECIIRNNGSYGVRNYKGRLSLTNCVVAGNSGRGISSYLSSSYHFSHIINCTIIDNGGYGIYDEGGYSGQEIAKNCIFWGNGDDLKSFAATYSCIEDMDSGTGNIHSYPVFVDADPNNFSADNDDYHLCYTSPCIGAGENGIDIGAYPYELIDTIAPTPNPATFASVPTDTSSTEITMTATAGDDASEPIEYNFECTSGGGHDSGWQTSPVYSDTALTELTEYTYTVKMRDSADNTGTPSSSESATTSDGTAPTPNPASFATLPYKTSTESISMAATVGTDASGPVEYYFTETSGNVGGNDSVWQASATYTDEGLMPDTTYSYTVMMRDAFANVGAASEPSSVITVSEIYVDANSPDNNDGSSWNDAYTTIQAGIDNATSGETILVAQGVYNEQINFNGKKVALRSTDPNDSLVVAATIIDASGTDPNSNVVTFSSGETSEVIFDGFTVAGGDCGISLTNSSAPSISKCCIRNNSTYGIYLENDSAPIISKCEIRDNNNYGLYNNNSKLYLTNSIVANNLGSGVYSQLLADTNDITQVNSCTIVDNALYGIIDDSNSPSAQELVKNCIIWNNGDDVSGFEATYSCVEDPNTGTNNFSYFPYFTDPNNNDYHLLSWSPCIDAGDNSDYSNEPDYPNGKINLGAYGNTVNATAVSADSDGDGLPDAWELNHFGSLDYGSYDGVDGTSWSDGDDLNNMAEYLYGYDPNAFSSPSSLTFYVGDGFTTQIDPIKGDVATISYYLDATTDVEIHIITTDATSVVVRTISKPGLSSGSHIQQWDGRDDSGNIVKGAFYNVEIIDTTTSQIIWTSASAQVTNPTQIITQINDVEYAPYRNIPLEMISEVDDWALQTIMIYKAGGAIPDDTICTVLEDGLLEPGSNTFSWYGYWGDSTDGQGKLSTENYEVSFGVLNTVNKGTIVVYYDSLIKDIRCNPYRVIASNNEVTTISYDLAYDSDVTINIYDPVGNLFRTFSQETGGEKYMIWDGKDANGKCIFKSGPYKVECIVDGTDKKIQGTVTVHK